MRAWPGTAYPLGATYDGVGTNFALFSEVAEKTTVDACGKKLEVYRVKLTNGLIAGLSSDGKVRKVDFTETIDFGLQFGGLPLRDQGTVSTVAVPGAAVVDQIKRTFDFTINSEPKPARAAR